MAKFNKLGRESEISNAHGGEKINVLPIITNGFFKINLTLIGNHVIVW